MNSKRRLQLNMSQGLIRDKLAEIIYQLGYVQDDEDVTRIELNTANFLKEGETVPVFVEVTERKKILLINHNEGKTT